MSDTTVRTQRFYGLNRQPFCEEGEMVDMKNLCSGAFPYIKTRECREEYKHTSNNTLRESDYEENVGYLPVASEEVVNRIYNYTYTPDEYASGAFYKFTGGKWERMTEYMCSDEVVGGSLKGNWSTSEGVSTYGSPSIYNDLSYENYMADKNYAVRYLGEDSEGFVFGKTYRYNVRMSYEWQKVNKSISSGMEQCTELPEANAERFLDYVYLTQGTETNTAGVYRCVCRYQGYWEECESEYTCAREFPEETYEGQIIRYLGEVKTPIFGLCYEVSVDVNDGEKLYFHCQADNVDGSTKVQELPEANEESYKNTYIITKPSSSGYYKCVYSDGEYVWKELERPDTTKALPLSEFISKYIALDGVAFEVSRVLRIHGHNGKLAALVQNADGKIAIYYDYSLYEINWASENTVMVSCGDKILIGDGSTYLDTRYKQIKTGADVFDFSVYADSGSMEWGTASGSVARHSCKSYISDTEIVLYSEKKEVLSPIYLTINEENIDFEIKTAYNHGFEYVTSSGASELVFDSLHVNLGDGLWDEWGMWRLTIPIQRMLFPPAVANSKDGTGEGWVYLRKTSKNTRFLWKNRLWGYDENNLISTILGVLDENLDIDWQTVADGRNDNGAYTLSFMTGGDVTGIAALRDYITVFKRNHLCTLSGNTSATFLMNTISAFGLSEENEKSIAVCSNTVFYMSDDGVYTFSGDYPVLISEKAKLEGRPVAAAADNRFYYLSLEKDGVYTNYRYDILKGLWYKMNNVHIRQYCQLNGKMLYIDADTERIMTVGEKEEIVWEAVLTFDEGTWRKKKYKAFAIYGDFGEIDILAKTDDGVEKAIRHTKEQERFVVMPIECETLTITIRGRGEAIIKGFEREFEVI